MLSRCFSHGYDFSNKFQFSCIVMPNLRVRDRRKSRAKCIWPRTLVGLGWLPVGIFEVSPMRLFWTTNRRRTIPRAYENVVEMVNAGFVRSADGLIAVYTQMVPFALSTCVVLILCIDMKTNRVE